MFAKGRNECVAPSSPSLSLCNGGEGRREGGRGKSASDTDGGWRILFCSCAAAVYISIGEGGRRGGPGFKGKGFAQNRKREGPVSHPLPPFSFAIHTSPSLSDIEGGDAHDDVARGDLYAACNGGV